MVILQKLQSLFKVLVYETSGTIASLALETSRNAKNVHYFQGKNRVIGEFGTLSGRPRPRQCLCEPTVCTVNGF